MILSDKQSLRKCVKMLVRHTETADIGCFNPFLDDLGVIPMLGSFPGGTHLAANSDQGTPITDGAATLYAAFDALGISLTNLEEADAQQKRYSREAWIREILDVMPAKCILLEVPVNTEQSPADMDNRFVPVVRVEQEQIKIGRYGYNLEAEAARMYENCVRFGTRQIKLNGYQEDFLRFCILPLCEDHNLILHIQMNNARDMERFVRLLQMFPAARCVVYASQDTEPALIHAASTRPRLFATVQAAENYDLALSCLGFRFLPQASFASLPEQMLGCWILKREQLYEVLSDRYLPLARAGYELTDEAIEADIKQLLSGNFLAFCGLNK
ncbi:MAG: hypothetical protein IJ242_01875 [Clostridia bacterium]|nr:hypothetical protein [Clostridia bacterium]